ncbi:MAG TPA: hypothetical protein VD763_10070 [Candidatus Saccharimonadales bacterium]|nr:hypothetical protein [Candidatus Saccharimonadales bacterium]
MERSVPEGHVLLDPPKEFIEAGVKLVQEDREGQDGRQGATAFDGTHEGPGEWPADRGLRHVRRPTTSAQLAADRQGKGIVVRLLQNS